MSARTRLNATVALIGLFVALLTPLGAAPASAAGDPALLEPDLRMAGLRDFRVTWSNNRKLLRFSAMMVNMGEGPFWLRGLRTSTTASQMKVSQIIRNSAGELKYYHRSDQVTMRYSGDGHDHWHAQNVVVTELRPRDKLDAAPRRAAKTGFCFFDTNAYDLSAPGAPRSPHYTEAMCGNSRNLRVYMGLSVGWGDKYQWSLAYQWIDVTNVPNGTYRVCSTVDSQGWYIETNDANNRTIADIEIAGNTVTLLGRAWFANCNDPRPTS